MMQLADLGERICILGPSNSGKSTLANAIARKIGSTCVHLDQLYHLPNTNWIPRPTTEFIARHDKAIMGDRWVMDGNYSVCMPRRLKRATGVIVLDIPTLTSLIRYVYRTLFEKHRNGTLEGSRERINREMIHHITMVTPGNRKKYRTLFDQLDLPKIRLSSVREINQYYRHWELTR